MGTLTTEAGAEAHLRTKYDAHAVETLRFVLDTAADLHRLMRIEEALEPELRGVRVRRQLRPGPDELNVRRPTQEDVRRAVDALIAPLLSVRDEVAAYLSNPQRRPTRPVPARIRQSRLRLEVLLVVEAARALGVEQPDEYDLLALENAGPRPHRAGSVQTAKSRWDQWRYAVPRAQELRLALAVEGQRRTRATSGP